jgi:hypothetical protein
MTTEDTRRNWKERNQGKMPQADPTSKQPTKARDLAKPGESDGPNGDVEGEPGSTGTTGDGTYSGGGSFGGTGSPPPRAQRKPA